MKRYRFLFLLLTTYTKTPWLHYTTILAATKSLKGFKAPAAAYMITTRLQPTRR